MQRIGSLCNSAFKSNLKSSQPHVDSNYIHGYQKPTDGEKTGLHISDVLLQLPANVYSTELLLPSMLTACIQVKGKAHLVLT